MSSTKDLTTPKAHKRRVGLEVVRGELVIGGRVGLFDVTGGHIDNGRLPVEIVERDGRFDRRETCKMESETWERVTGDYEGVHDIKMLL
jgi:hypothetical protein